MDSYKKRTSQQDALRETWSAWNQSEPGTRQAVLLTRKLLNFRLAGIHEVYELGKGSTEDE